MIPEHDGLARQLVAATRTEPALELTPVQRELFVNGIAHNDFSRHGLGKRLFISSKTVANHAHEIRFRLQTGTMAQSLDRVFDILARQRFHPKSINAGLREIAPVNAAFLHFTNRQIQVIGSLAAFGNVGGAADALDICCKTVKNHAEAVYNKMHPAKNRQTIATAYLLMRKLDLLPMGMAPDPEPHVIPDRGFENFMYLDDPEMNQTYNDALITQRLGVLSLL